MLKAIRRFLLVTLLVLGSVFLLYQGFLFWRALDKLPPGTTIAGVDVAGPVSYTHLDVYKRQEHDRGWG